MDLHESEDTLVQDPPDQPAGASERAKRAPAAAMLLVLLAWTGFTIFFRNIIRIPQDATALVWGVLIAGFGLTVLPIVMGYVDPEVSSRRRTAVSACALALFAVPLVLALFWSARDAMHPVETRSKNHLPSIAALVGSSRRDAERMLGDAIQTGEYKTGSGPAAFLKGIGAARSVGYTLPDLNRLSRRPAKQQELEGDPLQTVTFVRSLALGQVKSDAHVVVYYSADGKVVGALLQVSRIAAGDVLSDVTTSTVLGAAGLGEDARRAQGRTAQGGRSLDYYFRLDFGAGGAVPASANQERDLGDIMVFVAATPIGGAAGVSADALSGADTARTSASSAATSASGAKQGRAALATPVPGRSSHSDERFWVILCSNGLSEDDATQVAARLNAKWVGKSSADPNPFVVERSGHLQWVSTRDCWFVIFDVGFGDSEAAQAQVMKLGMPLALESRVELITKVCGESTIAQVVR